MLLYRLEFGGVVPKCNKFEDDRSGQPWCMALVCTTAGYEMSKLSDVFGMRPPDGEVLGHNCHSMWPPSLHRFGLDQNLLEKYITVRKLKNLTTSVTLLDKLPSIITIVLSNKRQ